MTKVLIKRLNSSVELPIYKTDGASGMDLMAFINESIILKPKKSCLVPTGIAVAFPSDFEIFFPNTSSTVTSEINYKLNDPEVRQLQAISLLTQGIFINEVSVSIEGVTNNIYEKVSEVFSNILGGSQGPLEEIKSIILGIKYKGIFEALKTSLPKLISPE